MNPKELVVGEQYQNGEPVTLIDLEEDRDGHQVARVIPWGERPKHSRGVVEVKFVDPINLKPLAQQPTG